MDVAPWAEHWIKMVLDGSVWYCMGGGGGSHAPEGSNFFPKKFGISICLCNNFTFTFYSESKIDSCIYVQ